MSSGLFGIGITGINAAQMGMMTTGHNIANVNTAGYNRQRISQSSNVPIGTGAGFLGQGTRVDTVSRIYNSVITNQINQSQANASELSKYYDQIKQIDNMLADDQAGLSPTLQDLFKGVQTVAANPSQIPARDSLVSSAQTFASRLQNLDSRLSAMYDGVNSQLQSTVSSINSYATQIADLNQRIIAAQAAVNQPANDLLDQRDQLIADLNKEVRVSTVSESDGSLSVFVGTGQQLVVGTRANSLQVQPSVADPQRMAVGLTTATSVQELPENLLTGGNLGGLLTFRSQALDTAANSLGQVAASVALTFNAQHALGQDMLGNIAGSPNFISNFFTMAQPKSWANELNTGTGTLAASFVSPPPMSVNGGAFSLSYDATTGTYTAIQKSNGAQWSQSGAGALNNLIQQVNTATGVTLDMSTANFTTNLTTSDYRVGFDGTNYTVTRLSDNKQWSNASATTLSANVAASEGFSFTLGGAMAAGDSFLVQPTREAARNLSVNPAVISDSRLFAAGQPVRTAAGATNLGTATISPGNVTVGYTAPTGTITMTYNAGVLTFSGPGVGSVTATTGSGTTTAAGSGPYTPPSTQYVINGFTFQISGTPQNGDTFTLAPNTNGVADGRNANLLGQLQTQGTVDGGAASFQAGYARLVGNIGNKTREAQVTRDAQQALVDQSTAAREAQSGVNLDEEAANLLKYQQAYQASAKMLTIGSQLFDTILSIHS